MPIAEKSRDIWNALGAIKFERDYVIDSTRPAMCSVTFSWDEHHWVTVLVLPPFSKSLPYQLENSNIIILDKQDHCQEDRRPIPASAFDFVWDQGRFGGKMLDYFMAQKKNHFYFASYTLLYCSSSFPVRQIQFHVTLPHCYQRPLSPLI